jgi:hypothetical protein
MVVLFPAEANLPYRLWGPPNLIQIATRKFLNNGYKAQKMSYMDITYFYSSKYIPP